MDDDLDAEGLSPLQAYDALRGFAERAGALPLRLALHAALPQVLHADLLHLLRLNFVDDGRANPVAEADVLFADFCSDLGHGYFRFDPHARTQLLAELDASHPGEQPPRSQQVAGFLLDYLERERAGDRGAADAMHRSWIEVERWNALAFADPEAAAEQLAQALQSATEPGQAAARLRVGTLASSLAMPLVRHQKLLAYAAGVQAMQAGAGDEAAALLRRLGDEAPRFGAVQLPAATEVLRRLRPVPPPAKPSTAPTTAPTAAPGAAASGARPGGSPIPSASPRPDPEPCDVYIAAAADDRGWALQIAAELRDLAVYFADLAQPDADGGARKTRALESSSLLVFLWSKPAQQSAEVFADLVQFTSTRGPQTGVDGRQMLMVLLDETRNPFPGYPQHRNVALQKDYAAARLSASAGRGVAERIRHMLAARAAVGPSRRPPTPTPAPTVRPAPLPAANDSEYTAYISYAHADDQAYYGWVGLFRRELERGLAAMLRGVRLPPLHLSGDNGPVAGVLAEQLRERLARSFALIVVVHDNYVLSEWCFKEVEQFRALFGEAAMRERLYIVALSEPAMRRLEGMERWRHLFGGELPPWLPFFDAEQRDRPLDIFISPEIVSPAFRARFEGLRSDLAGKLKQAIRPQQPRQQSPDTRRDARLYIESNRHERNLWEVIGADLTRRWEALATRMNVAAPRLRCRGLPIDQIDAHPSLDDADGVVLLWGKKSSEALVAQIDKVENKMSSGLDAAPGMVLYLMPPQFSAEPVPAWGWEVLRYRLDDQGDVGVVDDESGELDRFLRGVLEHALRRADDEAPGGAAPGAPGRPA